MKRYDCLQYLASQLPDDTLVVMNIGATSREWHGLRPGAANLYQVNLGLCTPVALGLAAALPHRKVVALDGDGNLLLNLASLCDLASFHPPNLVDIVLDNQCYEAAGKLPSVTAKGTDLATVARGAGFRQVHTAITLDEFKAVLPGLLQGNELSLLVAKTELGTVTPLPPLTLDGRETKYRFARYIEESEHLCIFNPRDRSK